MYKTHNEKSIDVGGTCLQGYIEVDYKKLTELFGKPHDSDGYKVDAEWDIEFEDGTVATIYNYKTGKNYNGKSGTAKTKITSWNIGGHENKVVELINKIIN